MYRISQANVSINYALKNLIKNYFILLDEKKKF